MTTSKHDIPNQAAPEIVPNIDSGAALLKRFNEAVFTLTINSGRSTREERIKVIEFFGRRRGNPDTIKILLDALRRFGRSFCEQEKVMIAEILGDNQQLPPLMRQSLRDSLEKIVISEKSPKAGAALLAALEKIVD